MNHGILQRTTTGSLDGSLHFPAVVAMLAAEGIESYHADLLRREKTYYAASGETYRETAALPPASVAPEFSAAAVKDAILASQRGAITYPEFLHRVGAAGTASYNVYIRGRRAIYWGRHGEFHVEEFPAALP